jgi:hypothetical protein
MEILVVETTLTDGSKVYAVNFAGIHESGAVLTVKVDCISEHAAKSLRDNLDAAYTAVWVDNSPRVPS